MNNSNLVNQFLVNYGKGTFYFLTFKIMQKEIH